MPSIWNDSATERPHAGMPDDARAYVAAWLPALPERRVSRADRARGAIQFALALTIFGTVLPSDLYLANWVFGGPIPALRDPIVINSLVTLSVALAVPVIPLALLALLLHGRHAPDG